MRYADTMELGVKTELQSDHYTKIYWEFDVRISKTIWSRTIASVIYKLPLKIKVIILAINPQNVYS